MLILKTLMLRKIINKKDITNILLSMNAMMYYHALYKIDKILWLAWICESKLIDINNKEYLEMVYWEEAKVISNREFLWKWFIRQPKIEYEVKMTDEKVEVIQSDYLIAQLLSNNFMSLTVQIRQNWLSKLLEFYFKVVILRKLKIKN